MAAFQDGSTAHETKRYSQFYEDGIISAIFSCIYPQDKCGHRPVASCCRAASTLSAAIRISGRSCGVSSVTCMRHVHAVYPVAAASTSLRSEL